MAKPVYISLPHLLPDKLKKKEAFTIGGIERSISLDNDMELAVAKSYTVNLRLQTKGTQTIDLSEQADVYTINDGKTYFFYCSKVSNKHGIKVTGGNPTIYLANVTINATNGNAIEITNGSPTIHIQGSDTITSSNGAGIFVVSGKTVKITAEDYNVLVAKGGNGGSGIGGYMNNGTPVACGNITITDIRYLYAHGSTDSNGNHSAGIGGAGNAACGTISITNATVHAYGGNASNSGAAVVGAGLNGSSNSATVPTIQITSSEIWAYRGAYATTSAWVVTTVMAGTESCSARAATARAPPFIVAPSIAIVRKI